MKRNNTVDEFVDSEKPWKEGLTSLRMILNSTELVETVKWGMPVYTIDGKNVVGLGSFKNYFGLWFYQGVFLADKGKRLMNAQEGRTKGMRQWRFNSAEEIDKRLVKAYIEEAIQNQKDGKEIKPEKKPLKIPEELREAFKLDSKLENAFELFTLSSKREFAEYIADAKRKDTKLRRLKKIKPMILDQTGLNDKYK